MKGEAHASRHRPVEIRVKSQQKALEIDFDDGTSVTLPAELLRVESPSAEVRGHGAGQRKTVPGRRHVGIMSVEPVGNYAIRITFDDLQDTGIYSWNYLHELGCNQESVWQAYLDRLDAEGLSRDP